VELRSDVGSTFNQKIHNPRFPHLFEQYFQLAMHLPAGVNCRISGDLT
jgi:hypothetical protein